MVFKDVNDLLYKALVQEYHQSDISEWGAFLTFKNTGLAYVKRFYDRQYSCYSSTYTIIDEQLWLFTKLKYGI